MKAVASQCEKVWLFDVKKEDDFVLAGLACFAPYCASEVELELQGEKRTMLVPPKAVNSLLPLRIVNARLSLLPLNVNE